MIEMDDFTPKEYPKDCSRANEKSETIDRLKQQNKELEEHNKFLREENARFFLSILNKEDEITNLQETNEELMELLQKAKTQLQEYVLNWENDDVVTEIETLLTKYRGENGNN